jgi:hypothetical protein
MRSRGLKNLIMGALVSIVLLIGVGTTTAPAQGRIRHRHRPIVVYRPIQPFWGWRSYWGPYPYYTYVDPITAQREQGYSDGRSRGKDDAKHGKANDPNSHKHYRDSNSLTYRQAFAQGYSEGYRERMDKLG